MNRSSSILTLKVLVAVGALILAAGSASAQVITLKAHTFIGLNAPTVTKCMAPWAERVEKASKGRIKVDIYPSMQLGGAPPQLIDQVRDGVVDIVWTLPGYTPGRFVKSEVFELPFVATNPVATGQALYDFSKNHPEEFASVHVLAVYAHAGTVFHSFEPIRKVSDVKGMKIRTPHRTGGWLLEAMGAVPIGSSVPQVPELLSKKVVDAVMLPYEITIALKTHEMVHNHLELDDPMYPRPNTSLFLFAMNKAKYDSLPADLRKVIDDNSDRDFAKEMGAAWVEAEKPGENAAKAAGGNMSKLAPDEVKKYKELAQPVYDRWIAEVKPKGIDGAALLKEAKELIAKYTK